MAPAFPQLRVELRDRHSSTWFRCYVRGTETCPKHQGRSHFRGGVGRRGDRMRLNHQPGSSFYPANGRDPRGHILRDGEETPADSPLVQKPAWPCCVCVVLGLWGECSKSEEAWKPAPGCAEHLGAGWGQALGCLEWGLGLGSLHSLNYGPGGTQSRVEMASPAKQPGRMLSSLCWSP